MEEGREIEVPRGLVSGLVMASGRVFIEVGEQKKLDLWEKHTWHVRC